MKMWITLAFALLITVKLSESATVGCGKAAPKNEPNINTRILNGADAKANSWPWIISQHWNGNHFCGGSLLRVKEDVEASDILLTAAHCVGPGKTENPSNYKGWTVYAGMHRQRSIQNTEIRNAVKAVHLKDYVDASYDDIALVKLDKPINFTDTIRPVCLPKQGEVVPAGKTCVVIGWGRVGSDMRADILQQLQLQVHTSQKCTEIRQWNYFDNEVKICAGPADGSANTCSGDSGSSLICRGEDGRWVQYGIVSYGDGGCEPGKRPSAHTRVSHYVNWIQTTIRELTSIR